MTTTIAAPRRRSKVAAAHRHHVGQMARAVAERMRCSEVAAQRRLERTQETLREIVAVVEAEDCEQTRQWLARALAGAMSALGGPRLRYSPELLADLAVVDAVEDGKLAKLIASPDCPDRLRAWLRAAEAESASRLDLIASARARLEAGPC